MNRQELKTWRCHSIQYNSIHFWLTHFCLSLCRSHFYRDPVIPATHSRDQRLQRNIPLNADTHLIENAEMWKENGINVNYMTRVCHNVVQLWGFRLLYAYVNYLYYLTLQNQFFTCNQKPLYLNARLDDFSVPVSLCFIYFTDQLLFNLLTH